MAELGYPYDFAAELAGGGDGYVLMLWERRPTAATPVQILAQPYFAAASIECGDSDFSNDITAADALAALRSAVGSRFCAYAICDSNGDGNVSASDAGRVLRVSVGQVIPLLCPPTGIDVVPPDVEP